MSMLLKIDGAAMCVVFCLRAIIEGRSQAIGGLLKAGGQIDALGGLVETVRRGARRRMSIGAGCSMNATMSEAAFINLIAVRQSGDVALCKTHASWLVTSPWLEDVSEAALTAGDKLAEAGLKLAPLRRAPPPRVGDSAAAVRLRTVAPPRQRYAP